MPEGCDISEHQSSFPGGNFDFVIIRLINENGGTDKRWEAHYAEAQRRGLAIGAYGIIEPEGIGPEEWANRYVHLLSQRTWDLIPTVDIELGSPSGNHVYASRVNDVLRSHYPVLMGYYSAASEYRRLCAPLYDRHWLAQWSSRDPGGDLWQYQGSPLDLDRCKSLDPIRLGPPKHQPQPARLEGNHMIILGMTDGKHICITAGPGHHKDHVRELQAGTYLEMAAAGVAHREDVHPLMAVAIGMAMGVEF